MLKWLRKEKHYTEQEIREIIKRDLPSHHLKRRPKKGEKNESSSDQG